MSLCSLLTELKLPTGSGRKVLKLSLISNILATNYILYANIIIIEWVIQGDQSTLSKTWNINRSNDQCKYWCKKKIMEFKGTSCLFSQNIIAKVDQKHVFKMSLLKKITSVEYCGFTISLHFSVETRYIYKVIRPQMAGCNKRSSKYVI